MDNIFQIHVFSSERGSFLLYCLNPYTCQVLLKLLVDFLINIELTGYFGIHLQVVVLNVTDSNFKIMNVFFLDLLWLTENLWVFDLNKKSKTS